MEKNFTHIRLILIIFSLIFILSSCVEDKRNLKSENYKAGIEVIDQIIDSYSQMSDVSFTAKYNQQLVSILSDSKAITYEGICFSDDAMNKIIAFESLKKVYTKYNLITDKNFTSKTAHIAEAIFASCNALDSLDINDEISDQLTIISEYVSASSFDENIAIHGLTEQYLTVWQKDVTFWKLLLNKSYSDYSDGIDEIPAEIFDEEKLSKFVYEPYSTKDVMVEIYKLNLKDEAYKEKETVSQKLDDIKWGFENINLVNSEYTKKAQDLTYVEDIIDKVKAYLLEE